MENEVLQIKNMVCSRCIDVVASTLSELGIPVVEVKLGAAIVKRHKVTPEVVEEALQKHGFELLRDSDELLVERMKQLVVGMVRGTELPDPGIRNSEYIAWKMGKSYGWLSRLFSSKHGITLERYIILQKIEYAKELIEYGELTYSQIAFQLRYKSTHHLSNQFKSITGMSMTEYKESGDFGRKSLDDI